MQIHLVSPFFYFTCKNIQTEKHFEKVKRLARIRVKVRVFNNLPPFSGSFLLRLQKSSYKAYRLVSWGSLYCIRKRIRDV